MNFEKRLCGAITSRGKPCRNLAGKSGRCGFHQPQPDARSAATEPEECGAALSPQDDLARLDVLQDAALGRALRAHRAGAEGGDKTDASFARNARLAATLARLRLALARKRGGEDGDEEAKDESAEVTIYRLPDNGR